MKIDFRVVEKIICEEFGNGGVTVEEVSGDYFIDLAPDDEWEDTSVSLTAIAKRIAAELEDLK